MADVKKTMANLNSRGFTALYFETQEEAVKAALREVNGADVGFGGSETLNQLGMADALMAAGCRVHSHWLTPLEENPDVYKNAQHCGVFMCSANAITEDGCLVNIDGRGNRLAGLTFGPQKLIIMAGINKLVKDIPAALQRIKGYAAGKNCRRLGKKTPCAVDLVCRDCKSPDRICRSILISEWIPTGMDKAVVMLINKELGY